MCALSAATALLLQLPVLWLVGSSAWWYWHMQWQQPACEMTYMYPSFVEVNASLLGTSQELHGYRLYEYVDGVNKPGPNDLVTPVLFIPGNAGNYMQVRCMASETARLWAAQQANYPGVPMRRVYMRWYAVDTGEELGAFDGAALERQTQYSLRALRWLATSYNLSALQHNAVHPRYRHAGVVLVGHSMGGVVARALMMDAAGDPTLGPSSLSALVTLAAPLRRPPLASHPSLMRFYASRRAIGPVPWVPLVSLSGGFNDTQVAHPLTSPHGLHPAPVAMHISTSAIPGVWLSPSHNVIVWCNQLLKPLSLFFMDVTWQMHFGSHLHNSTDNGSPQGSDTSHATSQGSETSDSGAQHHAGMVLAAARRYLLPDDAFPPGLLATLQSARASSQTHAAHPTAAAESTQQATYTAGLSVSSRPPQGTATAADSSTTPAAGEEGGLDTAGVHTDSTDRGLSVTRPGLNTPWWTGSLEGHECTGANLVWYQQYGKEKRVKARACMASCGADTYMAGQPGMEQHGKGSEQCPCSATLQLKGVEAAQKLQHLGSAGKLYMWRIRASQASTFQIRASSAPPCQSFRVWLTLNGSRSGRQQQQDRDLQAQQQDGDDMQPEPDAGQDVAAEGVVEVTRAAAWLPLAHGGARRDVRQWSLSSAVMSGVDYNATASWALVMPPELLARAAAITLWTGPSTNASSYHLSAQLFTHTQPTTTTTSSAADSPIQLSWISFLKPAIIPTNSPAILPVHIALDDALVRYNEALSAYLLVSMPLLPGWVHEAVETLAGYVNAMLHECFRASGLRTYVALKVLPLHQSATAHAETNAACTHSTLVMSCGLSSAATQRPSTIAAGAAAAHGCGDASHVAVSNRTAYELRPCWGHGARGDTCSLALLVDPSCGGYSVQLVLSLSEHLPGLVLGNINMIAQLAQAVILAVVAWQLHSLSTPAGHVSANGRHTANKTSPVEAEGFLPSLVKAYAAGVAHVATNPSTWAVSGLLAVALHWLCHTLLMKQEQELGEGSGLQYTTTTHVMDRYPPRDQLSISTWVTLLPGVAVLLSKGFCHASWGKATAVWVGACLPWALTSPRLSHIFSLSASRMGMWLTSAHDSNTHLGPSIVDLAALLACSVTAVMLLGAAVALLRSLLSLISCILWRAFGVIKAKKPRPSAFTASQPASSPLVTDQQGSHASAHIGKADATGSEDTEHVTQNAGDSMTSRMDSEIVGQGQMSIIDRGQAGRLSRTAGNVISGLILAAGLVHVALGLLLALLWLCTPHGRNGRMVSVRQHMRVVSRNGWCMLMALDCLMVGASGWAALAHHAPMWRMSDPCDVLLCVLPVAMLIPQLSMSGDQGAAMSSLNSDSRAALSAGLKQDSGTQQDSGSGTIALKVRRDALLGWGHGLVMAGCAGAAFACAILGLDFALFHVQALAACLLLALNALG